MKLNKIIIFVCVFCLTATISAQKALSSAVGADNESDENRANDKKHHRQGNLSADAGSKKATVGRRVLV